MYVLLDVVLASRIGLKILTGSSKCLTLRTPQELEAVIQRWESSGLPALRALVTGFSLISRRVALSMNPKLQEMLGFEGSRKQPVQGLQQLLPTLKDETIGNLSTEVVIW